MPRLQLGVLDQSPVHRGKSPSKALGESLELARTCDRLGYSRYWFAEHHSSPSFAAVAPEIMVSYVAAQTRRIRVGSGGVLLRHYSPLKVAECFRVLEALAPGRIDLGIGRTLGANKSASLALGTDFVEDQGEFGQALQLLGHFLRAGVELEEGGEMITAMPIVETRPSIWLLGSGTTSASYAAQLGLSFCFAHFISPQLATPVLKEYTTHLQRGNEATAPEASICVSAFASRRKRTVDAWWAAQARWHREISQGKPSTSSDLSGASGEEAVGKGRSVSEKLKQRHIAGDVTDVRRRIEVLAAEANVKEVLILTNEHDLPTRIRSYELLADAFELARRV